MRTSLHHDRSSTISQCENTGPVFGKKDEYNKYDDYAEIQEIHTPLPAWPAIAFDLFFALSGSAHHNWPCVVRCRVKLSPAAA